MQHRVAQFGRVRQAVGVDTERADERPGEVLLQGDLAAVTLYPQELPADDRDHLLVRIKDVVEQEVPIERLSAGWHLVGWLSHR